MLQCPSRAPRPRALPPAPDVRRLPVPRLLARPPARLRCPLQMLVQPLDRIFHVIRTNASQVVTALGTQEVRGGTGWRRSWGRSARGQGSVSARQRPRAAW